MAETWIVDAVYAAGLIDAAGHIAVTTLANGRWRPVLRITSPSVEALERAQRGIGAGHLSPAGGAKTGQHHLLVTEREAVLAALLRVGPHLVARHAEAVDAVATLTYLAAIGTGQTCLVAGCIEGIRARGLCQPHYVRARRAKVLRPVRANGCAVCGEPRLAVPQHDEPQSTRPAPGYLPIPTYLCANCEDRIGGPVLARARQSRSA